MAKVYELKNREKSKPIAIFCHNSLELLKYVQNVPEKYFVLSETLTPGPLTFVFRKNDKAPRTSLTENPYIGVRIPNNEFCLALTRELGKPFAATSANVSGEKPAIDAESAAKYFKNSAAAIFDGGKVKYGIESTVLKIEGEKFETLREGAVPKSLLRQFVELED